MRRRRSFHSPTLHRLMLGLFYPAVLGTIFYSFLPILRHFWLIPQHRGLTAVATLIVLHFTIDYIFTARVTTYGIMGFCVDLVAIFLLSMAFDFVNYSNSGGSVSVPACSRSLAMIYGMFFAWDLAVKYKVHRKYLLMIAESILCISFVCIWRFNLSVWVLATALLAGTALLLVFLPPRPAKSEPEL